MGSDTRLMEIYLEVESVKALRIAITSSVIKKSLKPKVQSYCVEFATWAGKRLEQAGEFKSLRFTVQVEAAKSLVLALDEFLEIPKMWDKIDKLCDEVRAQLRTQIAELPSIPTQTKMKL